MTTLDAYVQATQARFRSRLAERRSWDAPAVRKAALAIADAVFITIAALAAYAGRYGITFLDEAGLDGLGWVYYTIPAIWLALLALCGAYSLNHLQTGMVEYQRVALASGFFASARE